ncbi:MAG TPA: 16S rRNA (cytosine(967)-C(5))-methyltransferase RsmB [Rhodocyclaceae bacterium]|nr:16S rRNA (cytosine(967)-C(5))-methyltransferase RsmB [Rhodocyclaceae bacterium]
MTARKPAARHPALAHDSLAYAFCRAAELVAAVIAGRNLTDAFERMQHEHPQWTDAVRGAVRDHAWGSLRDYGRGDLILRRLVHKALPADVHALLLVALHRLENRPEQAYVVVDQAVAVVASIAPALKGLANAVLRNSLRQADTLARALECDEPARHRHPQWWIDRLRASYPNDWAAALAAGNTRPPMSLRANRRRTTPVALERTLGDCGLAVRRLANHALLLDAPVPLAKLPGFAAGLLSVQDAGAQWAAQWLDLAEGQRVLDACAAPGGKAAHILETADVELLALELDARRAERVRDNFRRLGLAGEVRQADASRPERWWDGRPFDRILADVPCSASGVVRRHPDIKWLRRPADIASFVRQQRAIVEALWHTLAPDGKMLYVTCSLFEEENRGQIEALCVRHPDMERVPLDGRPDRQLLPNAEHDGFYYALLHKRP